MFIPVNFSGEIHQCGDDNEQGNASKQQGQLFQLYDDKYEAVKYRKNKGE